jgi:hypothetical protein
VVGRWRGGGGGGGRRREARGMSRRPDTMSVEMVLLRRSTVRRTRTGDTCIVGRVAIEERGVARRARTVMRPGPIVGRRALVRTRVQGLGRRGR